MRIAVSPAGEVDDAALDAITIRASEVLGAIVERGPALAEPGNGWDPAHHQLSSTVLLCLSAVSRPEGALRHLVVTERDLAMPMLTFIFGQAQLGGGAAIVSLARLRQEFHGLSPDPALLRERAAKSALHELGHTFGLIHCRWHGCVMSLATGIGQLDAKGADFCPDCAILLAEGVHRARIPGRVSEEP